jgi:hypothetical protein
VLIYRAVTRYTMGAIVVGVGVLSHGVLDAISHRPDTPLWPGGPKVGLGLWYSVPATVVVKITLLAIGLWLCRFRSRGVWATVAVLLLAYKRLSAHPEIRKFVDWVRNKPAGLRVRSRRG